VTQQLYQCFIRLLTALNLSFNKPAYLKCESGAVI